jgi:hypothetical protein
MTIKYSDIRDSHKGIESGDKILWIGDKWYSRIIQKVCFGYSHASSIIKKDGRVYVVEANMSDGQLVIRKLSEQLFIKHGKGFWLKAKSMTPEQRKKSEEIGLDRVASDIKYDRWGCVEKWWDFLCRTQKAIMHQDKIYCFGDAYIQWELVDYAPPIKYAPGAEELINASGSQPIEIVMDEVTYKRAEKEYTKKVLNNTSYNPI